MSWKPEVHVEGKWSSNALVFATEDEAREYAIDLFTRWSSTAGYRAVMSEDPVNYSYVDGALRNLTAKDD